MPGHIASVFRIDACIYDIQIFEGRLEPLQLDPMPPPEAIARTRLLNWKL